MISEKNFSRGYTSFWAEFTPWLNDYVSFLNEGFVTNIEQPLHYVDDVNHRSINNILAFTLFKNAIENNNNDILMALDEAKIIASNYPRNNLETYTLMDTYEQIVLAQTDRLLRRYRDKNLEFYPQFSGCGIMESCEGDILSENSLIEIKAGTSAKGILPSDIKQSLVYSALDWLSENSKNIIHIELYNPRQGIFWESNIEELIKTVSNHTFEDFFDQFGKYLVNLSDEIQL